MTIFAFKVAPLSRTNFRQSTDFFGGPRLCLGPLFIAACNAKIIYPQRELAAGTTPSPFLSFPALYSQCITWPCWNHHGTGSLHPDSRQTGVCCFIAALYAQDHASLEEPPWYWFPSSGQQADRCMLFHCRLVCPRPYISGGASMASVPFTRTARRQALAACYRPVCPGSYVSGGASMASVPFTRTADRQTSSWAVGSFRYSFACSELYEYEFIPIYVIRKSISCIVLLACIQLAKGSGSVSADIFGQCTPVWRFFRSAETVDIAGF